MNGISWRGTLGTPCDRVVPSEPLDKAGMGGEFSILLCCRSDLFSVRMCAQNIEGGSREAQVSLSPLPICFSKAWRTSPIT